MEKSLHFKDVRWLQTLVGEQDANLKLLEKELSLKFRIDHQNLIIIGEESDVELAADLFWQLKDLLESGENIFPGDLERGLKLMSGNRNLRLRDVHNEQIRISGKTSRMVAPKTPTQRTYVETIKSRDLVFGVGPAGTGKTYLAMAMAVAAFLRKDVRRIVLCRPAVEAGEKLGFLPGDMAEKINPYLRPLYDALFDLLDFDKANGMIEKGEVEVAPLAFMRGRTLSNSFIILDEAQNTTSSQMKMLLTRLGPGSKCVVTGDTTQVDLPRGTESGLIQALNLLQKVPEIGFVYFNERDVVRHKLVASIIKAYESES
jgi:phosphate starvation-inducible protein PhoH and related proteins